MAKDPMNLSSHKLKDNYSLIKFRRAWALSNNKGPCPLTSEVWWGKILITKQLKKRGVPMASRCLSCFFIFLVFEAFGSVWCQSKGQLGYAQERMRLWLAVTLSLFWGYLEGEKRVCVFEDATFSSICCASFNLFSLIVLERYVSPFPFFCIGPSLSTNLAPHFSDVSIFWFIHEKEKGKRKKAPLGKRNKSGK